MLVVERATDQERLDSVEEEFHELREMIAAQFSKLDVTDQSKIIEAFLSRRIGPSDSEVCHDRSFSTLTPGQKILHRRTNVCRRALVRTSRSGKGPSL